MQRFWLAMGLLSFLSEAEKLILLNGLALGWLGCQIELRDLRHKFGFAMGLLSFLSEGEKLILPNGLAAGWLGFKTEFKGLIHRFGLAMGLLISFQRHSSRFY